MIQARYSWFEKFISFIWLFFFSLMFFAAVSSSTSLTRNFDAQIGWLERPASIVDNFVKNSPILRNPNVEAQFGGVTWNFEIGKPFWKQLQNFFLSALNSIVNGFLSNILGFVKDVVNFLDHWVNIFKNLQNYMSGFRIAIGFKAYAAIQGQTALELAQEILPYDEHYTFKGIGGLALDYNKVIQTIADAISLLDFVHSLQVSMQGVGVDSYGKATSPTFKIANTVTNTESSVKVNGQFGVTFGTSPTTDSVSVLAGGVLGALLKLDEKYFTNIKESINKLALGYGSGCSDYVSSTTTNEWTFAAIFGSVNGCTITQSSATINKLDQRELRVKSNAYEVLHQVLGKGNSCGGYGYVEQSDASVQTNSSFGFTSFVTNKIPPSRNVDFSFDKYDIATDAGQLNERIREISARINPHAIDDGECQKLTQSETIRKDAIPIQENSPTGSVDIGSNLIKNITKQLNGMLNQLRDAIFKAIDLINKAMLIIQDLNFSGFNTIRYITTTPGGVKSQLQAQLAQLAETSTADSLNTDVNQAVAPIV